MKARLLVELDGASPDSRQDYDVKWHQFLRDKGFGILRFSNEEIAGNLDNVVLMIFDAAENLIKSQTSA